MRITESELRSLAKKVLTELFSKKKSLSVKNFLDNEDINPYDYSGDGADFGGFYEADEENIDEDEESVE